MTRLIALCVVCCWGALGAHAQRWLPVLDASHPITDAQQGPDQRVTQMLEGPGGLWVGGWFDAWHGQPSAPLIRYDGDTWSLPDPSDFPAYQIVRDLLVWEDNLYVAGGADWDPDIIRYDPVWGWQEIGGETDGSVRALCGTEDFLMAGGSFSEWDDEPCGLALFDGLNWEILHGPLEGNVHALAYHDDRVFVGGSYSGLNATHAYIATYQDGAWLPAGNGLNGTVHALEILGDTLYAEGSFTADLLGTPRTQVVKWAGGDWVNVDLTGVEGSVDHLFLLEGQLAVSSNQGTFVRTPAGWTKTRLREVTCTGTFGGQTLIGLWSSGGPDSLEFYHNDSFLYRLHPYGKAEHYLSNDTMTTWAYPALLANQRVRDNGWHFGPPEDLQAHEGHALDRTSMWFSAWQDSTVYATGDQGGPTVTNPPHYTTYGPFSEVYDNTFADRYLRVWTFTQDEIAHHLAHFTEPGYQVPEKLASYPGNGRVELGESAHLAPFVDQNQNGWYEPELGDIPAFCTDQAAFSINHDAFDAPDSDHMGLETVVQVGIMNEVDALDHAVFVQLHVTNASDRDYQQVRFGVNTYGRSWDRLVGSAPDHDLYYYYHQMDAAEVGAEYAVVSFIGFPEAPMENFIYYESPFQGDPPDEADEFDHYLNGRWRTGAYLTSELPHSTYDETDSTITRFHYPAFPWEEGWNEFSTWGSALSGYRLGVGGHGLADLPSGATVHTGFWTYAEPGDSTGVYTLSKGLDHTDAVHAFYRDHVMHCVPERFDLGEPGASGTRPVPWHPYPNPTNGWLSITCDHAGACPTYLQLRSITGQLVQEWVPQQVHPLNVSHLASGVYFLTDPYRGDTFKLLVP